MAEIRWPDPPKGATWISIYDLDVALQTGDHPEIRQTGYFDSRILSAVEAGLLRACRLADGRLGFARPLGDLPEVGRPVRVINPDSGQDVFPRHRSVVRVAPPSYATHHPLRVWVEATPSSRPGVDCDLAVYPSSWVVAP